MTHGVTNNLNAETLARLVGGISTLQSLPLIPSGYALTISPAGSVAAADAQISAEARAASPTAAAPLFDTAVVQSAPAPRLELAA